MPPRTAVARGQTRRAAARPSSKATDVRTTPTTPTQPAPPADAADAAFRAVHDAMRATVLPPIREFLDVGPQKELGGFKEVVTAKPQVPGVPRPAMLTVLASAPTLLGWYGFYKYSIEEELYQYEISQGNRATGFGGYGTLLPFVYAVAASFAFRAAHNDAVADVLFSAGSIFILATQVNLYVRVNALMESIGEEPPLHAWWALLPPPLDVVVGLRQVHFLSVYWSRVRGESPEHDPLAESWFPFIASERFTLKDFVREPRRWFGVTRDWRPLWEDERRGG